MKYLFIELNVQDGENRHTHRVLHTTGGTDINFVAEWYAAHYYGTEAELMDGWWNFQAGCIGVKVVGVRELSEFEYNLMSDIFSSTCNAKSYFEIVHAGYQHGIDREEIQIHAGENGNIFLIKTPEGFVIDAYGQNDIVDTMAIFEDDLNPKNPDEDKIELPDGINDFHVSEFKKKYGKNHMAICNDLGYPFEHNQSDELLMVDYFFLETTKHWYPIISLVYTPEEQLIADYLRLNR